MRADLDIGSFSKRTLLTGAGWTRNWGGRLGMEVWQDLMGHQAVQSDQQLRELLLRETSFETALAMTHQAPFTPAHREALEHALIDTFTTMDREIARHDHSPWINIYRVQDLLFRFWGDCSQKVNTGYLFTLNQDLWFERNLYNQPKYSVGPLSLPGLERQPDQRIFSTHFGHYSDQLVMKAIGSPVDDGCLRGQFNVIKLHGSFNWQTTDGGRAMVVGTQKNSQIASSPLLEWYVDIFKRVLSAGDVRLMIVGYGFGDAHVNAVISDAVSHHGLKIFIWNTDHDIRKRILEAPHGAGIWSGLLSTATRQMIDVFPSKRGIHLTQVAVISGAPWGGRPRPQPAPWPARRGRTRASGAVQGDRPTTPQPEPLT